MATILYETLVRTSIPEIIEADGHIATKCGGSALRLFLEKEVTND